MKKKTYVMVPLNLQSATTCDMEGGEKERGLGRTGVVDNFWQSQCRMRMEWDITIPCLYPNPNILNHVRRNQLRNPA
jgi:hypothetical protein